jgi:hypothetical protein
MKMRVKYKTPHNIFYRRIWRVKSVRTVTIGDEGKPQENFWEVETHLGRKVWVPLAGTVFYQIGT